MARVPPGRYRLSDSASAHSHGEPRRLVAAIRRLDGPEHAPCPYYPQPSPPLMHAATVGGIPFRVNLHVGDVGHTLIFGPTGAGKSTLLATIAMQARRYPGMQIWGSITNAAARDREGVRRAALRIGRRRHARALPVRASRHRGRPRLGRGMDRDLLTSYRPLASPTQISAARFIAPCSASPPCQRIGR